MMITLSFFLCLTVLSTLLPSFSPALTLAQTVQPIKSSVVEVNDSTFDQLVTANSSSEYILFLGAEWCGYCRMFKNEFDLLSQKLSQLGRSDTVLLRADVDKSPGLSIRFYVSFLPALYHIKNRKVRTIDFSSAALRGSKYGKRNAETFIRLVEDNVWGELAEWSWVFGPWGPLGVTLTYFGAVVSFVHSWLREISNGVSGGGTLSSEYAIWIVMIGSVIGLTIFLFYFARISSIPGDVVGEADSTDKNETVDRSNKDKRSKNEKVE